MSEKVDVLAAMRDAHECLLNAGIDHHALTLSIVAIAELIAADRELRAAEKALFQPGALANGVQPIERFKAAAARQEAALAAVGGEGQG